MSGISFVPMLAAWMMFSSFAQMGAVLSLELRMDTSFSAVSLPPVSPVHSMVSFPLYSARNLLISTSPLPLVVMVKVGAP